METPRIFESEYRFCLLLWEYEPVNSTKLVSLCKEQLGWSKATTYTVIRRLSERGIVKNENAQNSIKIETRNHAGFFFFFCIFEKIITYTKKNILWVAIYNLN